MKGYDIDYFRLLKSVPDSDDIRWKQIIKKRLLKNKDIVKVLNNKSLEESGAEPGDYFGVNIFPYYIIDPTQTHVDNFICYETSFDTADRENDIIKYAQVIFYVLCDIKTLVEPDSGIARHDLLCALLLEEFNWTNLFGTQIHCVQDKAGVTDDNYAIRTIIFESETPSAIVKTTRTGKTRIANYGINVTNEE